jgi:phage terminase large subunit-like protein
MNLMKQNPKSKVKNKGGRPRLYTKEEIQKSGVGIAGRSKRQIRNILNGEKQDRTPVAYKPWVPLPKEFKGAERVKEFFRRHITHTVGEWKWKSFNFLNWQIDLIDKLFGTFKENGLRQYKKAYLEIAKKNGKTELAAAIGIYLLLEDEEGSPEVILAACDVKQAYVCFKTAAQMVRQDEGRFGENGQRLSDTLKILDAQKKLYDKFGNGVMQVVSSETASKHGLNISGLIFDELHAQKTPDLYKVLTEGSGAARQQPLFLFLTTAGWDRKSICWQVHSQAKEIENEPEIDPTFLPIIYSMPEGADWRDEANWGYPNPALGEIIRMEELHESFRESQLLPSLENDFRQLRLNEWTQQQIRWISVDRWDECKGKIDLNSLQKKVCYGGLDLSSTQDLTAFLLVFPSMEGYIVLCFFFCPEENIEKRSHKDKVPYDIWAKQGLIIPTPGEIIDYSFVLEKIRECKKLYDLKEIAFDRYRATELTQKIMDEGITVVPISQNQIGMDSPIKELEKLVLSRKLSHGGNPVLRWMCNNVTLKKNAGGLVMFDKNKSNEKIDGMTALVMGIDRAMRNPSMVGSPFIILGFKKEESKSEDKEMKKTDKVKKSPEKKEEVEAEEKPVKFPCARCEKDTEGIDFCVNCGRRRNQERRP